MDTIGLDLHKRESQLCVLTPDGTAREQRILTSRERFTAVLGPLAPATVLLEASTESEWVARHLEALGLTVIVADPNYAPMDATRARRVKTDRRDARPLAEACRLAKSLVRRDGLRVAGSESERVAERIAALELSPTLAGELAPLFALLAPLNAEIAAADRRIAQLTAADPVVARLTTAPGVGPITASARVATIDDITRFRSAHEFEAYLGVVPGERSSGETRRVGRITKAGNARVRGLLVEAAWRIVRSRSEETATVRAWALAIATRRGTRGAVVALARRLAGILYARWRDGAGYDGGKVRAPQPRSAPAA